MTRLKRWNACNEPHDQTKSQQRYNTCRWPRRLEHHYRRIMYAKQAMDLHNLPKGSNWRALISAEVDFTVLDPIEPNPNVKGLLDYIREEVRIKAGRRKVPGLVIPPYVMIDWKDPNVNRRIRPTLLSYPKEFALIGYPTA